MTRLSRQHMPLCLLTTAILLATAATPVFAQDGAYIVEQWAGRYLAVKIQPGDQKIVSAGDLTISYPDTTTETRMTIARYDSLGNRDNTYGIGGPSIPPLSGLSAPALGASHESGWNLVFQPNGKAVVSGSASASSSFAVARFNTDGTLDSGFGSGGWNSLDVRAGDLNAARGVGLQSNGKIIAAGISFTTGFTTDPAEVARFTAAGVLDSGKGGFGQVVQGKAIGYTLDTFGPTLSHSDFADLIIQPDDKLVAVGSVSGSLIVVRYTASGTLDRTFNGNGYSMFLPAGISLAHGLAVALQTDGKIVVAGYCTGTDGADDLLVARFNTNGTLDTSFGGGSGYVRLDDGATPLSQEIGRDVAIQPDGKFVVVGETKATDGRDIIGPGKVLVVRLNANGTLDGTFGTGGSKLGSPLPGTGFHDFWGMAVALQADGSIIVAGTDFWGTTGDTNHPLLMRFNP
jgi:uncharacterized delta-60 repeat protein